MSFLPKVTPYSLRRGHISLRILAGEDIKRIADECGTSTAMIHRHYLHELDVRHELPEDFSFDGAVEAASRGLRHLRVAQTRRAWRVIRRWKAHGLRVPRRGYTGLRMDPLFGSLLAGWHVGRGGQKAPRDLYQSSVGDSRDLTLAARAVEFAGLLPS
jgi:hypothetical protein